MRFFRFIRFKALNTFRIIKLNIKHNAGKVQIFHVYEFCSTDNKGWTLRNETLSLARFSFVAMVIPDEFEICKL